MNIQSSKKERQVFSWVNHSASQHQDGYRSIWDHARTDQGDPMQMHFQKLFLYGIGFLALLILAPFILLGLIIAITALL